MNAVYQRICQLIHPIILKALSLSRSVPLHVDGKVPVGQQYIFVANHYCINDIPTAGEAIKQHFFVLVSDEDKWTLSGLALFLNGVVWTNRSNKAERKKSKEKLEALLKSGHSILMYPEATWNLSPNLLMLPMNYGCVTLSLQTNVPIMPIYLFFDNNICYAKIGHSFYPTEDKEVSIIRLRDAMATMAWEFIEKYGRDTRKNPHGDYWEMNIANRYNEYARAKKTR